MMDRTQKIFVLLCFLRAAMSVEVTLEGGQRGVVYKEAGRGQSTTLECRYASSTGTTTPPSVEWIFTKSSSLSSAMIYVYNGKVTPKYQTKLELQTPANLVVKNLTAADTGLYECRVVIIDDTPAVDQGRYNFTVLIPPYPNITCGFPLDLQITTGRSAAFQCAEVVPEASPAPTYTWYKDNVELPTNSTETVTYNSSNFHYNTRDGQLVFTEVVEADRGVYYCAVRNKVGNAKCGASEITTINGSPSIYLLQVLLSLPSFGMLGIRLML